MMRVVAGDRAFEEPREVLRGHDRSQTLALLDRTERALDEGWWAAGYVGYDWQAAIGIFAEPRPFAPEDRPVEHSPLLASTTRHAYAAHVDRIKGAIYEGDVYQVNYTVPFAFATAAPTQALYAHYALATGARYQAYVEDGDRAILSWSPELFLEFDGSRVRAKPMKGTAAPGRIGDLGGEKNRAEHVMIVDLLRNDLHRVCDDVEVERFLTVEHYPTFATMTSTIAGTLMPGTSLGDVFAATFPCGSVTGAPKRAAMRFIAEHEAQSRGAYCGTIGFLSPQRRGWWNVAIRTAQLDATTGLGRFDAGGAIVADSQAADEWDEIALKARFLERRDFALLETFAADAGERAIDAHFDRLAASARAFGIPFDGRPTIARTPATLVRLRLQRDGTIELRHEPLVAPAQPVRVCLAPGRVRSEDPFLLHKTTWRPLHAAAAAHASERGCFDALMRNERGELTEGTRTNLFVDLDGVLWTPPRTAGLLPGILRERIVSEGRARERTLAYDDLVRADALYVGNSARGLLRAELAT